ncbi:hypothetical protein E2C01_078656 [Portunus trituberculatus]|uniref:Uncharacterized protein n=1 Tax=Portunus trituberculatus TaxID=210409 RepID=A0A5B7IJD3_PORTR|nr:hypothetical protein [Portunus trituberculatus]
MSIGSQYTLRGELWLCRGGGVSASCPSRSVCGFGRGFVWSAAGGARREALMGLQPPVPRVLV